MKAKLILSLFLYFLLFTAIQIGLGYLHYGYFENITRKVFYSAITSVAFIALRSITSRGYRK